MHNNVHASFSQFNCAPEPHTVGTEPDPKPIKDTTFIEVAHRRTISLLGQVISGQANHLWWKGGASYRKNEGKINDPNERKRNASKCETGQIRAKRRIKNTHCSKPKFEKRRLMMYFSEKCNWFCSAGKKVSEALSFNPIGACASAPARRRVGIHKKDTIFSWRRFPDYFLYQWNPIIKIKKKKRKFARSNPCRSVFHTSGNTDRPIKPLYNT